MPALAQTGAMIERPDQADSKARSCTEWSSLRWERQYGPCFSDLYRTLYRCLL